MTKVSGLMRYQCICSIYRAVDMTFALFVVHAAFLKCVLSVHSNATIATETFPMLMLPSLRTTVAIRRVRPTANCLCRGATRQTAPHCGSTVTCLSVVRLATFDSLPVLISANNKLKDHISVSLSSTSLCTRSYSISLMIYQVTFL